MADPVHGVLSLSLKLSLPALEELGSLGCVASGFRVCREYLSTAKAKCKRQAWSSLWQHWKGTVRSQEKPGSHQVWMGPGWGVSFPAWARTAWPGLRAGEGLGAGHQHRAGQMGFSTSFTAPVPTGQAATSSM